MKSATISIANEIYIKCADNNPAPFMANKYCLSLPCLVEIILMDKNQSGSRTICIFLLFSVSSTISIQTTKEHIKSIAGSAVAHKMHTRITLFLYFFIVNYSKCFDTTKIKNLQKMLNVQPSNMLFRLFCLYQTFSCFPLLLSHSPTKWSIETTKSL